MYPNPAQHKKKKFPLSKEKKETPMMTTTGFFKTKTRLLPSAESPLQEQKISREGVKSSQKNDQDLRRSWESSE
jgi:hypothetical protein